ncbi:protein geranylgeranyltransferase type I subunit CDC43 NDAI_0H03430 [Naumovozyma dairenensis CBS 421]|uniref:Prenyltransferase alpha-alpha toroid domain-containing protein n=1 Tax=Naumovozyma dairenensis (strain ATCC 10597 / BCRC 20456 / CBS 421 / NBRC 0211 / NRRL Y-12639) TaxID=1071378 RepID=G0WFF5_NAUDC|nr:hypothetical protein NDAI_0H03430 [Naumovozyma dairenensis CBS 421]CCD26516.1 hypothetical protein NDAI_0H03430 [Naumovozyma dairenensis CBS 421]
MFPTKILEKHVKFVTRHLNLLPSTHQNQDVNRMAIIFYAIETLSSLDPSSIITYKKKNTIHWIRSHYLKNENISGFIGSKTMAINGVTTITLPNTLFALLTLLILDDKEFFTNVLDCKSVCRFVSKCQDAKDGSFVSVLRLYSNNEPSPVDSNDLRFCYIAVAILYLCGCKERNQFNEYIDVEKMLRYIKEQQCDMGGYGTYGEPHAGYTSCALSALYLLDRIDEEELSDDFKEKSITWLLHRQIFNQGSMSYMNENNPSYDECDHGGFQGRENKFGDTCYVFWCLNSLKILEPIHWKDLCDTSLAKKYLLERTQNTIIGGFSKNDEDDPDLYHTCLGIAALKLIDGSFDGVLCIPSSISSELTSINRQ